MIQVPVEDAEFTCQQHRELVIALTSRLHDSHREDDVLERQQTWVASASAVISGDRPT
jgi:hypothetical protein